MPGKKKQKKMGDAKKGEKIFKNQCGVCHQSNHHTVGPGLDGVVGSNIASAEGFTYSAAILSRAN